MMRTPVLVSLKSLGVSDADLAAPSVEVATRLDDQTTVLLVLREALLHLRPAAKAQLLTKLGLDAAPGALANLVDVTPARVANALFSAFLSEAVLHEFEAPATTPARGLEQANPLSRSPNNP
jgi:hypothetical protein